MLFSIKRDIRGRYEPFLSLFFSGSSSRILKSVSGNIARYLNRSKIVQAKASRDLCMEDHEIHPESSWADLVRYLEQDREIERYRDVKVSDSNKFVSVFRYHKTIRNRSPLKTDSNPNSSSF
jgi:hypothetical protein